MQVVAFDERYADEMARLYAESYSESEDKKWTVGKARESLEVCYKYFRDYCFLAMDENGKCMGGIFCLNNPYYDGNILFIISVQVKPEYRKLGVGEALMKEVINKAKESALKGVRFLTDSRKEFPKSWYKSIGFKESGYVEYEADIDSINL
jgi:N-acetylglutamate synthase-like GNAT family acetyltransferase